MSDFAHLRRHASAHARFVFDDVCEHSRSASLPHARQLRRSSRADLPARGRCEDWHEGGNIHLGAPTLAVCDLVRSGALLPPAEGEAAYGGVRQWVVLRASASLFASANGSAPTVPACKPRCKMRWTTRIAQRAWTDDAVSPFGRRARQAQARVRRASGCDL